MKMTWVTIADMQLRCVSTEKKDKPYRYEEKTDDGVSIVAHSKSSPTEVGGGELHQYLKKYATQQAKKELIDELGDVSYVNSAILEDRAGKHLIQLKNELEANMESTAQQDFQEEQKKEKEIQEKYDTLEASFNAYCAEYNMTPLELIVATSHCLGVGNPREIINAFFGYFQTYTGIKATNVIAVGNQASGKSFMLENALSMIPEERVHKGVDSVAYFFRKYNGKDLSGHIFFMGDLGGDFDNNNTIEMRDTLKELTTDGYKKRGIVDKDSMEEEDQFVTGNPCLSYTTANEELINDQEKSRSIILTPQILDSEKLMIYNSVQEAPGKFYTSLNLIKHITKSVQGFTFNYSVEDKDFFNPYMFTIEEHLKNHDDFTRKIQEYEAILKIVTCLHHPFELSHEIYVDSQFAKKQTPIVIASKQDNINALNIFSSSNLLPDEIKFANGLIESYEIVQQPTVSKEDFDADVREWILDTLDADSKDYDNFAYNSKIDEDDDFLKDYLFSVESLKKKHRNKQWFRKSGAKQASNRLQALYNEGILVKVGKSTHGNMNVYALNTGMDKPVEEVIPEFKQSALDKAVKLFTVTYPDNSDELLDFLKNDTASKKSLFETVEPIVNDLPYLDGVADEL